MSSGNHYQGNHHRLGPGGISFVQGAGECRGGGPRWSSGNTLVGRV